MSLNLNKKILILIPALNPEPELETYVEKLKKENFENILIIDDGSERKYQKTFQHLEENGCHILRHEKNQGKGKAIKNGLKFLLNLDDSSDYVGVVTVDCDGQHLVKDIINVAKTMEKKTNSLVLGSRDFTKDNVPHKSSFGNKMTSKIFKILYGVTITDTQTGLRGIPLSLAQELSTLAGDRYEYETNMLIDCIVKKINIEEVPIETIYIDNNSGTHFRPIRDSVLIYGRILNSFIKYSVVSLLSTFVDLLLFQILVSFLKIGVKETTLILVSTILARLVSSLMNFYLNKNVSFKSSKDISETIFKYYFLCIVQMIVSGLCVSGIFCVTRLPKVAIKIVVDTILFIVNFRIQKNYIFEK